MGITIHYAGKAKSPEAFGELLEALADRAEALHWKLKAVDEDLKGRFYPSWGHGYGYIPSAKEIQGRGIEFFPEMVKADCNGYFKLYDTKYVNDIREGFDMGMYPKFHLETHVSGIILYPHEKCEPLKFIFNMKTLELGNYEMYDHTPDAIYSYNSCSCKTQFAGFKTHALVCETIRLAEQYIDFSKIKDEAEYYHSRDLMVGIKNFNEMMFNIKNFQRFLNDVGKRYGLSARSGDEM